MRAFFSRTLCVWIPNCHHLWVWLLTFVSSLSWFSLQTSAVVQDGANSDWKPGLADFALPSKSVFPPEMPRYPNLWFYVEESLAATYPEVIKLVTRGVQNTMRLREIPGPFDNPEGCDSDFRLEHLQPWEAREHRSLQHCHAFHLRYYHTALESKKLNSARLKTPSGEKLFSRLAASVHYEVEHTNPNHADVEICPICGRTGRFGELKGNLVEMVHDPLGLELLLNGTIRGEQVRFEDWKREPVESIAKLSSHFSVQRFEYPGLTNNHNTLRIGIVVLSARQ